MVMIGKDKGKTASIAKIDRENSLVFLDGINKKIKHVKGREGNPGERVEFFAPIALSNVAIIDPKTKKPSRVGYKIDAQGVKVRISKKSGEEITTATATKKSVAKKDSPTKAIKA